MFYTAKFENMINQVNKRVLKTIPPTEEKALFHLNQIQEKFDLKNVGFTLANMTNILKNIKDEVTLSNMEFPYANEIMGIIIETLYSKEGSISSIIEEYLLQKGLDVIFFQLYN